VIPSRGFQSCMDYKQVIGIGKASQIDSMIVIWPDRTYDKYEHPAINQLHLFSEKSHQPYSFTKPSFNINNVYFDSVKTNFDKHTEEDYVDFYYERNVPQMLSREGPKAAVGDVNGDGLDDIYIGGANGGSGQLYLQTGDGKFIKKEEPVFKQFPDFEDGAVLFFDADKDGDLDLFIGAGGNNNPPFSRQTQNRLYKNDGKGNFTLDASALPNNGTNVGVVAAYDWDGDGDMDLFVGSRNVPLNYGITPTSSLLLNDGNGHFTNIAKQNPAVENAGMITGAVWADVTGDARKELIVTGEWMQPKIFSYSNGAFNEVKTNLSPFFGLWQTVAVADVNGDGKQDLLLGNIGENFYLHPDSAHPVKLFMNDFNGNGNVDKILTYSVDGKDMPVFMKRELQDQIPIIKKQNLRYDAYATKSIQELFPGELMKKSIVKQFNYCSSIVAINKGNGQFEIHKMPAMTQMSSVNAIRCMDVNGDGFMDVVLGGNLYNFLPQFERLDASFGDVLINDRRGNFSFTPQKKTGLEVQGEVRDIAEINSKNKTRSLLFLINNNYPVMYRLHSSAQEDKKR
ncbi:MAG: FG-GAP-like repeat-containing protein, partial [Bacteroidota bacterium]|nr:FG-GAP-like repeat-containing protein [Bacteroidota bacterium]